MRAPFQVLVFPYQILNEQPRYLIGKRSDNGVWQVISGGGEDSESFLEAAKRELKEETGRYAIRGKINESTISSVGISVSNTQ
ncbi:NUDIX domain-containing protein [Salinivibrio kushneri]|uniref:NUDIX domain-containing protein n=1 Tax=Salinivibrio kushneri TaxID=1908198 RepID=UPI00098937A8